MKMREFDALKLDVEAFANDGASLQGEWPATTLERLADLAAPESAVSAWPALRWSVRGERLRPRGQEAQTWLYVTAHAEVSLTCQRCLQAMPVPLLLECGFRFVRDEATAAALDADAEDDVLVTSRHLDLRELIEDELLLALPLVPRHEQCPKPLPLPVDDLPEIEDDERPNPFAALAALKGLGPKQ